MTISLKEIKKLSISERIILAEKIWDSIPADSDELTISSSDRRELDRRLNELEKGNVNTVTWDQVKSRLRNRRK